MINIYAIGIGIVAGVITTILISLTKALFEKVLIPWYLQATYKGVDLSGNWTAKDIPFTFNLEVKQRGHIIKGVLTISMERKESVSTSSHYVDGEIWEGHISLKCRSVNRKKLSFGNLLLRVESGELIKGMYTARMFGVENRESRGIGSIELSFSRET